MTAGRFARWAWKALHRPDVAAARVWSETVGLWERAAVAGGGPRFGEHELLRATGEVSVATLWQRLVERPYPAVVGPVDAEAFETVSHGVTERLRERADRAMRHEVNLLGSGPTALGTTIDWHTDFKTGLGWPPRFFRDIAYHDLDRPNDVKVPWELSRLQWMLPAGQYYLLTGAEQYATAARDVLDQWITGNPYAASVNWSCTMEVALRILTWTWLFHACHRSRAWSDEPFRGRFLSALWLHGRFTLRHLEAAPIAGNHYTADAAGIVFAGLFFGGDGEPARWRERGWEILSEEIHRQTLPDGVNHEASVPYHRLVLELFHFSALYRQRHGLPVPHDYREALCRMARYTRACIRPDGLVPVVGDADDARALPFGTQDINDHRYLPPLIGVAWGDDALGVPLGGPLEEVAWVEGAGVAANVVARPQWTPGPDAFPDGGAYVLRAGQHYAYVDCGPVGMRGRGGHGHNDCLSLEVVLDGVPLVSDCGSYVYTAAYLERNRFRATDAHNTPLVDGEEINRVPQPRDLWSLHDDAKPLKVAWDPRADVQTFVGGHTGYLRLPDPVMVWRAVRLATTGCVLIVDRLEALGPHRVTIPFHLAPGVEVVATEGNRIGLRAAGRPFVVRWEGAGWTCAIEAARVSRSYGMVISTRRICWTRQGSCPMDLGVVITRGEAGCTVDGSLARLRDEVLGAIGGHRGRA